MTIAWLAPQKIMQYARAHTHTTEDAGATDHFSAGPMSSNLHAAQAHARLSLGNCKLGFWVLVGFRIKGPIAVVPPHFPDSAAPNLKPDLTALGTSEKDDLSPEYTSCASAGRA